MQEDDISINTQDPEVLAALVKKIDADLTFIEDLNPEAPDCRTLLVNHKGAERILKVRSISNNVWDDTYFFYEIHALRRIEERNLTNVTHLLKEYKSDKYHALLKTYATGTPCNTIDHERLLNDKEFIKKLDALYMKLHLAGIAKIHFQPRKIIIGPDDELTLIDLSTCIVNTEAGIQHFSQEMRADSQFISKLERAAKQAESEQR